MKTSIGLDIGTSYIKYIQLEHLPKQQYRLISAGMCPAPNKGLSSEAAIDREAFAATIKKLFKDGGIKSHGVVLALPETNAFTRVIQVPPLSERELASAIRWEAEQYIPMPLEEVIMDFSVVGESKDKEGVKKLDILLVAAPKNVIERYTKILELADLEPQAMETEVIAASRALMPTTVGKLPTVMIINFGAQTTDFSVLKSGVITFIRTIPTGGGAMTRVLSQDFGFSMPQAEEYKKAYGLDKSKLEGKVSASLKPIVSVMIEELKRSLTFFQGKYPEETISSIIISGGTAKLPGLAATITETTGIETQIGNPWQQVQKDQARFQKIDDERAFFVVATGLAMREI